MRQLHGLEKLRQQYPGRLNAQALAGLLLTDLASCCCTIYGCIGDDSQVVLAKLDLLADSLTYEMFDQRIDFTVAGPILRADCVPLTYCLQGLTFSITGRCSVIARVCGVDLYLQRSYTGVVGNIARQKFSIDIIRALHALR